MNTFVRRAAIAVSIPLLVVACGGGRAESDSPETAYESSGPGGSSPQSSGPSPAVAGLKISFTSPMRNPLATAVAARLQSALVAAGYTLVQSETATHDLTAKLVVTAVRKQSMFNVTVNGRQRVTLQVHAVLTIAGAAGIVDEVTSDFESDGGAVGDDSVAPLVTRLNGSPGLSRYAASQANARQAQKAAAQAVVEQAAQAKLAEDEAAWQAADPPTCAAAAAVTACAPLDAFLKARPNSPHAQEAQRTLDAARPALAALADTAGWANANPAACKAPRKTSDCAGIDAYIGGFANGAHVDEARAIRDASSKAMAALEKQEQARADAEMQRQAQEQKRQEREDCKKDCKENMCAPYVLSAKYDLCLQRCVTNKCSD